MNRTHVSAAILLLCFIGPLAGQELVLSVEEVGYQHQPIDETDPPEIVRASSEALATPGRPFFARAVHENQELLVRGRLEANPDGSYRIDFTYHHREATLPERRRLVGGSRGGTSLRQVVTGRLAETIELGRIDSQHFESPPGEPGRSAPASRSSLSLRLTLRPFDAAAMPADP